MIKIDLSEATEIADIKRINELPLDEGGIYFLFDVQGCLVYIGRSVNLKQRLYQHVNGLTHTSSFYHEFKFFKVLFTNSRTEQKIYELWAINEFRPKHNKMDLYDEDEQFSGNKEVLGLDAINLVLEVLKMNKGTEVQLTILETICKNKNLEIDLMDDYFRNRLRDKGVFIRGRTFTYQGE